MKAGRAVLLLVLAVLLVLVPAHAARDPTSQVCAVVSLLRIAMCLTQPKHLRKCSGMHCEKAEAIV
jgi:hypothetical protein